MTTPSSISQFLALQQSGVLGDFRDEATTCLIATTSARLAQHSKIYGWSISHLGGVQPKSALVVQKPGSVPELWVRANYRGYRRAFIRFLEQQYGLREISIPKSLQVDHLQPSSRFNEGSNHYFVRLALVERNINASYGAGFERLLNDRERERKLAGGIHMDWMAYLKIRAIRLPAKAGGQDSWKIWAWRYATSLASDGFDTILTYVGLTTMLNLAFRDTWQPLPPHSSFRAEAEAHPSYVCVPQLAEA
ncbi:hypothetical protein [Dechloromonas denitrificans]|uniref:hypothetical protein n=1 Tax=Dechloromonas denitrificans TaxID=281362 RepID=UPI001CF89566|nr:hypothetical protein [Dechloromonas denitrificans]UCV02786.1 hypothetical protein KI611_17110 [Dechloromonas denitrificans]